MKASALTTEPGNAGSCVPAIAGFVWRETVEAAWYRGAWWLWLLRPLEAVFRAGVILRRGYYRRCHWAVYRAPVPVVVVGNITVGGTGKTPVVVALIENLQQCGLRVGVVSRGFGGSRAASPRWVDDNSEAQLCGDEPVLIRRRTRCACVVAANRAAAVRALLQRTEVDIIISDDGLQHYALARDFEIALLDEKRGTGNGFCLPAGPLREPLKRLRTVDYLLYRGSSDALQGVQYQAEGLVNLATGEQRAASPDAFTADIVAVAGIGQPEQFLDTLRGLGFAPQLVSFPDHYNYTRDDFMPLLGKLIIMTEKDAVKCAGLAGDNAWYLKISAQLPAAVTNAVAALAQS